MKTMFIALLAILIISAPGCKGGGGSMAVSEDAAAPALSEKSSSPDASGSASIAEIERKIIKTATLRFRTGDIDKTRSSVDIALQKFNGYISSENNNNNDFMREQYLELKVPASQLDSFIAAIASTAKDWETKSISATDVTEEYIDVAARLKTKKELEARYLELLQRAGSVSDVLQVEAQLATVRGEIESMEGRIKYLNNQVAYSTVNLSYYVIVRGPVGFFGRMGEGFVDGWRSLLEFMIGLMRAWPFVLIFTGGAWWIIKRWRKKRTQ